MTRDPHDTIDLKDRKYPAPVASLTTARPLVSAARFIANLLSKRPVDGILLVGDLAHQGDQNAYGRCVDHLVETLLGEWCKTNQAALCVPGNHDIDRDAVIPGAAPDKVWDKFNPLEAAWRKHGLAILATNSVKSLTFRRKAATVELIALNSCLGCGEYRGLPRASGMASATAGQFYGVGPLRVSNAQRATPPRRNSASRLDEITRHCP